MHIPHNLLETCPVTAGLAALGLAGATVFAHRAARRPSPARFAAVSALVFAAQMANFPVAAGTSGHLLGGVLAAVLLGVPFGVLAMTLVVVVQTLVFADGGLSVLGANVLNLAIIGAGAGGLLHTLAQRLPRFRGQPLVAVAVASFGSVILAALACAVEIAAGSSVGFMTVAGALLSVHLLIGAAEAGLTVAAVGWLGASAWQSALTPRGLELAPAEVTAPESVGRGLAGGWASSGVITMAIGAVIIGLVVSPFASALPDGLESVLAQLDLLKEGQPLFAAPLADYQVAWVTSEALGTSVAAFVGIVVTFAAAIAIAWPLTRARRTPGSLA